MLNEAVLSYEAVIVRSIRGSDRGSCESHEIYEKKGKLNIYFFKHRPSGCRSVSS